jgi:predicted dehydrogenase
VVVGMGKRGLHHAAAFQANSLLELAAVSDIDGARAEAAAVKLDAAVEEPTRGKSPRL